MCVCLNVFFRFTFSVWLWLRMLELQMELWPKLLPTHHEVSHEPQCYCIFFTLPLSLSLSLSLLLSSLHDWASWQLGKLARSRELCFASSFSYNTAAFRFGRVSLTNSSLIRRLWRVLLECTSGRITLPQ